jgi:hypothetical protein
MEETKFHIQAKKPTKPRPEWQKGKVKGKAIPVTGLGGP